MKTEVYSELYRAIEKLPRGIAQVIKLYYLHEKKLRETREIPDIPIYTVKSRRARGVKHLRRMVPGWFRIIVLIGVGLAGSV